MRPALVQPGVRDLAALQHDVIDATLGKLTAHRKTGVTGTDDDGVDGAGHAVA